MSNISDVRPKTIKVMLDKERTIRFTLNSFADLEERYGSIDVAMNTLQDGSIKGLRTLLWAGLIHEDEQLTERQVGNMIDMSSLTELTVHVTEALELSLPPQLEPATELEAVTVAEGNSKPSR